MLVVTDTEQPLYYGANSHTFAFAEDCHDNNNNNNNNNTNTNSPAGIKPGSKPEILTKVNDDGSTSNYFDKRKLKIAPRSTLQFKVGPPFHLTNNFGTVIDLHSGRQVLFEIHPRIDRGFDSIGDEWVGYKRNYFTLVSSFEAQGYSLDDFLNGSFQLSAASQLFCGQTVPIKYFAMVIRAKTDDSEMVRIKLVQHTAKRDKGPQFEPQVCPLIPSQLPRHQIIREASNVRNENKMKKYESTFFFYKSGAERYYSDDAIIQTYPTDCIQKVARYERVQFAASISTKKPGQASKYFKLHVVLGAVVDPRDLGDVNEGVAQSLPNETFTLPNGETGIFFDIQEMETSPLVIRGRSPSNYTGLQHYSYSITRDLSAATTVIENVDTALVAISSNLYANEKEETEGKGGQRRAKNGRPAKRTAKVVRVGGRQRQSKAGKENVSEVAGKDGDQGTKKKKTKRKNKKRDKKGEQEQQQETEYGGEVQTLEQIQHIILTQLPLYSEQLGKQALERKDSPATLENFAPVEPSTLKTTSIGLKDIELRPSLRGFLRQSNGCTLDTLSLSLKTVNPDYSASVDVASIAIDYSKYYRPRSSSYDTSNSSFCGNLRFPEETTLNGCGGNIGENEEEGEMVAMVSEKDNYDINNINISVNNDSDIDLCDIDKEKEGEEEGEDAEYMSIENISFTFYNHTRHINTGASEEDFDTSLTMKRELSIEQYSQLTYGTIWEQIDYHATRYMLTTSGSNWESTEEVIRGELISTGEFV